MSALATVESLREAVLAVEQSLDSDTYRPGPWGKATRTAGTLPMEQRVALSEDISRVSDKLHRRNHPGRKLSVRLGVILELIGAADSVVGIYLGLRWDIPILVWIAAFVLSYTMQPLVKMLFGTLLGVRYSYFYLELLVEPRVKMRYGTYLTLSTARRVIFHLAGMIGSPIAFLMAAPFIADRMPITARVCYGFGWGFVGLNVMLFVLGLAGSRHVQQLSSCGAAAREIKDALRARTT